MTPNKKSFEIHFNFRIYDTVENALFRIIITLTMMDFTSQMNSQMSSFNKKSVSDGKANEEYEEFEECSEFE